MKKPTAVTLFCFSFAALVTWAAAAHSTTLPGECGADEEGITLTYPIPVVGNNRPDPTMLAQVISDEIQKKNSTPDLESHSDETVAEGITLLYNHASYVGFDEFRDHLLKSVDEFIQTRAHSGRKVIFLVGKMDSLKSANWVFNIVREHLEEARKKKQIDFELQDVQSTVVALKYGNLKFEDVELVTVDDAAYAGSQLATFMNSFVWMARDSMKVLHFSMIVPYWGHVAQLNMRTQKLRHTINDIPILDLWTPQTSLVKIESFKEIRERGSRDVQDYLATRFRKSGGAQDFTTFFGFAHKIADPGSVLTEPVDRTQYWFKFVKPGDRRPPPYKKISIN